MDFGRLFDDLPTPYLVLDRDFVMVAANRARLDATLTRREDIIGRGIFEVFPDNPDDPGADGVRQLSASLERVLVTGRPDTMAVQRYDIPIPEEEGGGFAVRHWSPRNIPLLDATGAVEYIVHQVEDVTSFVELEQEGSELRGETARMQQEILRRSEELSQVNEELRAASAAKSTFLSRMSHELRTPLNAIGGFSELLTTAITDPELLEWAEIVERTTRHLTRLVDDVLDITRLDAGGVSVSIEPIAIADVLSEALEVVRPTARAQGVRLLPPVHAPGVGYVHADGARLRQVFINVLTNAVKYNRPQGSVTIEAMAGGEHTVRVVITDTGAGIAPDDLPRLFAPFDRLGHELGTIEGAGLGLALSRDLLTAMGATIDVRSTVGSGTAVHIELRAAELPNLMVAPAPRPAAPPRVYDGERILVYIEDNALNVRYMQAVLRRRPSIRLVVAGYGEEGIERVRAERPHLVILDRHLPDMYGTEILRRLKADEATRSTPVVMLSADVTSQDQDAIRAAGALEYLTKPVGAAALVDVLDRILGGPLPDDTGVARGRAKFS